MMVDHDRVADPSDQRPGGTDQDQADIAMIETSEEKIVYERGNPRAWVSSDLTLAIDEHI